MCHFVEENIGFNLEIAFIEYFLCKTVFYKKTNTLYITREIAPIGAISRFCPKTFVQNYLNLLEPKFCCKKQSPGKNSKHKSKLFPNFNHFFFKTDSFSIILLTLELQFTDMSLVLEVDRPIFYLYLMNILSNCQKATLTSERI